ncbi:MAG: four helix bundle protein, partial [Bacteroidaceae bacterium]|nr:four helix bundle protein [Bacteroidaceae bacterium]
MKESLVYNKSLNYAIRIVNLYNYMIEIKKETIMSKQLLRCGTSIGANVSEALCAESTADFIHKLSISQKEANETMYWL